MPTNLSLVQHFPPVVGTYGRRLWVGYIYLFIYLLIYFSVDGVLATRLIFLVQISYVALLGLSNMHFRIRFLI